MGYIKLFESFKLSTDSKFIKWFSGSEIIEEDGTPMIMYHGSPHIYKISEFKNKKGYSFFTSDEDEASRYTNREYPYKDTITYIKTFYIRATNIFDPTQMDDKERLSIYNILENNYKLIINDLFEHGYELDDILMDAGNDELMIDSMSGLEKCIWLLENSLDNYMILESIYIQSWITSNGYDSFKTLESGGGTINIAVYHPNQIKSTDNLGEFSTSNNIFESKRI